jgi:hypothetical protein
VCGREAGPTAPTAVAAAFDDLRGRLAALPRPGLLARARGLLLTKGERKDRAEAAALRYVVD